jgi:hypothetical protein
MMRAGRFEEARPGEIGPDVTPNDVRPPFPGGAGPNSGPEAVDAEGVNPVGEGPEGEGPEGEGPEGEGPEGEGSETEDPGGNPAGRAAPFWAAATRGPNHVEAVVPGVGLDSGTGNCTGGRR